MAVRKTTSLKRLTLTRPGWLLALGLCGGVLPCLSVTTAFAAESVNVSATPETATVTEVASAATLPSPLSLAYVLSQASQMSVEMQLQKAKWDYAHAQIDTSMATHNVQANLQGRLGQRDYAEKTEDFHLLALHVGKVLYDFNQNRYQVEAAQQNAQAEQIRVAQVENQYRLNLMERFFNVLLADFQYRIDNEDMAVAYVAYDKAKERHQLSRISDVDLLAAQNAYEKIHVKRSQAEYQQLQTRLNLANSLNMPNARPDELSFPDLKAFASRDAKALNLDALQTEVLENNLQLQALNEQIKAKQLLVQSKHSLGKPVIRGDAWAGQLSSYPEIREGNWRVELAVDVPLYDGGASDSAVALAQAELSQTQAQMQLLSQQLRDQVADLYFQLQMLKVEKAQNKVFGDYSDLYLDYSRALYENESTTDLGDAMVRLSQANYNVVALQFKEALLWAQLDYLKGKSVDLSLTPSIQSIPKATNSAS